MPPLGASVVRHNQAHAAIGLPSRSSMHILKYQVLLMLSLIDK